MSSLPTAGPNRLLMVSTFVAFEVVRIFGILSPVIVRFFHLPLKSLKIFVLKHLIQIVGPGFKLKKRTYVVRL